MESPPTVCANTETSEDLSNPKIVQSYILAPYHYHNAMASSKLEIPTRTECLQDSPYHHMNTENAYETSIIAAPTTNATSPLYSPTQSNRMGDASKISACSTTSYYFKLGHLSWYSATFSTYNAALQTQTPRVSSNNMGNPLLEFFDMFMDNSVLLTQAPLAQQQQEVRQTLIRSSIQC